MATFMIIVKSPGNGLIVILHRTAGGRTERRGGGRIIWKKDKETKTNKIFFFFKLFKGTVSTNCQKRGIFVYRARSKFSCTIVLHNFLT